MKSLACGAPSHILTSWYQPSMPLPPLGWPRGRKGWCQLPCCHRQQRLGRLLLMPRRWNQSHLSAHCRSNLVQAPSESRKLKFTSLRINLSSCKSNGFFFSFTWPIGLLLTCCRYKYIFLNVAVQKISKCMLPLSLCYKHIEYRLSNIHILYKFPNIYCTNYKRQI